MAKISINELKDVLTNAIIDALNKYEEVTEVTNETSTKDETDSLIDKIRNADIGDRIPVKLSNGQDIEIQIAGFNTEPDLESHVTCIAYLGDSRMGNSALHGYAGAKDMQTFLDEKAELLKEVFGDHLLLRNVKLSIGVDDSEDEDRIFEVRYYEYFNKYLTLLSETEVFGKEEYSKEYELHRRKYPIFAKYNVEDVFDCRDVWLRGVASSADFCFCTDHGLPGGHDASYAMAAVALFCIKIPGSER